MEDLMKELEELKGRVEKLERPYTIHFAKTKEQAIIPTRRTEDAGYDMYACFDEDILIIPPHEMRLVPTGIATCFDHKLVFKLSERSSTGTKQMAQRCGVIDSGYRGEIQAPISNLNNVPIIISKLFSQDIDGEFIPLTIDELSNEITVKEKKGTTHIGTDRYLELTKNAIVYPYNKAVTQGILYYIPETVSDEIPYETLKNIASERGTGWVGSSKK
jgi:dUTP pyrophosphatase